MDKEGPSFKFAITWGRASLFAVSELASLPSHAVNSNQGEAFKMILGRARTVAKHIYLQD